MVHLNYYISYYYITFIVMKTAMSSFDVLAIAGELQSLKDARINKVFQVTPSELKIAVTSKELGKVALTIEAGRRVHLTDYPKPSPKRASTFAMTIRKHIENGFIKGVRQIAFDRILEIEVEKADTFYLICELFGKGNVVLTDSEYKILAAMKVQRYTERALAIRSTYALPPQRTNPLDVSHEELSGIVKSSDADIVRTLATRLGLGGLYAEEVCLRSGVPKNKTEATPEDIEAIHSTIKELSVTGKSVIVLDGDEAIDVLPDRLQMYKDKKQIEFETFNKAADEYFTKHEIKRIEGIRDEKFEGELEDLESRLKRQEETLKKFETEEKASKAAGDLIYQHFNSVEDILTTLTEAKRTLSWDEIKVKIEEGKGKIKEASQIKKILPKEGVVIIDLDGTDIRLDLRRNVTQNADRHYTKSKKVRAKILGVKKAIDDTRAKIKKLKETGKEAIKLAEETPKERVVKKREWHEKFRWFVSSDGFLVLGGRDATSNEMLVKKHMGAHDVFVHADIHGAPAVVIMTEGKDVPKETIQEAFDFAATYSRAWKHSVSVLSVYWVKPEQVSKTAEHGEYVSKGAFIIRGKKNTGSGTVEAAIGIKMGEEVKILGGPPQAISQNADYFVKLVPGRMKSKETALAIKNRILEEVKEEDKEKIQKINISDIQVLLPAGESELAKKGK
jgi:predicted ribosome quality control (RQC) complex YloA/Tae2 family protein